MCVCTWGLGLAQSGSTWDLGQRGVPWMLHRNWNSGILIPFPPTPHPPPLTTL